MNKRITHQIGTMQLLMNQQKYVQFSLKGNLSDYDMMMMLMINHRLKSGENICCFNL